jgi:hypothetical protein
MLIFNRADRDPRRSNSRSCRRHLCDLSDNVDQSIGRNPREDVSPRRDFWREPYYISHREATRLVRFTASSPRSLRCTSRFKNPKSSTRACTSANKGTPRRSANGVAGPGNGQDFNFDLIEPGIAAADFVIVPVKASPIDLEAIDPIIEICEDIEKPYCILLTQYDSSWKLSKTAIDFLEKKWPGRVLKDENEQLGYRQAYVGSMIAGQTGPEYNADKKQATAAAKEINAIWRAVKKLAAEAVK